MNIIKLSILILSLSSLTFCKVHHHHQKHHNKHHHHSKSKKNSDSRKLHHDGLNQEDPNTEGLLATMNPWMNPGNHADYGMANKDGGQMPYGSQDNGHYAPRQGYNPTMMHPSMSGMTSPFLMNSMNPQNSPYMLGRYSNYHPANMLHPLHPFNPYNTYAGMAFNPMMSGPYGFGGATYMDSYIDGPDDGKLMVL